MNNGPPLKGVRCTVSYQLLFPETIFWEEIIAARDWMQYTAACIEEMGGGSELSLKIMFEKNIVKLWSHPLKEIKIE